MSAVINGRSGMIKQPSIREFIQGTGYVYQLSWRGHKKDAAGLEGQLIDAGYDTVITPTSGPNVILTARIGTNDEVGEEVPVDRWEVSVNADQTDILNSELAYNLTDAEIKAIDAWRSSSDVDREDPTLTTSDGEEIFNLVKRKQDSIEIQKSVIRFTRTISRRYARSVRLSNVGRVFTTAQMVSIEGCPTEVLEEYTDVIPTRLQELKVRYGYLKKKPAMNQIPGARWQIVIEWEAGLWPTFPYPNASA